MLIEHPYIQYLAELIDNYKSGYLMKLSREKNPKTNLSNQQVISESYCEEKHF